MNNFFWSSSNSFCKYRVEFTDLDFEVIENNDPNKRHYCTEEQKNSDACIEIYQPVCGWNDPDKVQCIKWPCAETYSNSCFACTDKNVLYWTAGECPI